MTSDAKPGGYEFAQIFGFRQSRNRKGTQPDSTEVIRSDHSLEALYEWRTARPQANLAETEMVPFSRAGDEPLYLPNFTDFGYIFHVCDVPDVYRPRGYSNKIRCGLFAPGCS